MKFFAILALAASAYAAVAAPAMAQDDDSAMAADSQNQPQDGGKGWKCQPGTYACSKHNKGWLVCDVGGKWVWGGACPAGTKCDFNWQNKSPYCIPKW